MVKGVRPRFFYATQTAYAPPTITVFCSDPRRIAPAYERYLGNQMRAAFGLEGTPLRLRFRPRSGRNTQIAPPRTPRSPSRQPRRNGKAR
jgi:GTP-binding protein